MLQELMIFSLGFAAGYYFKVDKQMIISNGLTLLTLLNDIQNNVKDYFTYDYIIKSAGYYINGEFSLIDDSIFEVDQNGIYAFIELRPQPLIINYNYKKKGYTLVLKNARQIKDVKFKQTEKNIANKILSIKIDDIEVLPLVKSFAGPYGNFYCLPEVTFDTLFPGCEKIEVINEFCELETFRSNVNIISLI